MRKEWLLALVSVVATLALSLGVVRWLAPQWLGVPIDLQMVRVAKEVPPFFDGVFRREDFTGDAFIIADPVIRRAKPLYPDVIVAGPNDILGFRNRHVPNVADVIAIGDSQTYGNNAPLEMNWPSQIGWKLRGTPEIYGMAVGTWGGVQYYEIFAKAIHLQPRAVIVAFYTGNDPLESFSTAYADERWLALRPNPELTATDAPTVEFPAPPAEQWPVRFPDGLHTVFTPKLRYASNQPHPAVRAGYAIMARSALLMGELAKTAHAHLVFTIIPTKELVYAERIGRSGIQRTAEYAALVDAEQDNIQQLAQQLRQVPGAQYVDLVAPLQQAALNNQPLYPEDRNGHPIAAGYSVIADVLAPAVADAIPVLQEGFVLLPSGDNKHEPRLIRDGHQWAFSDDRGLMAHGWDPNAQYPMVSARDLAGVPYRDPTEIAPGDQPTSLAVSP